MMDYEKANVIEECIDRVKEKLTAEWLWNQRAIEALEQFKAEVDILAAQEAEKYATSVNEDKEIKQGTYLDNEIARGNIKPEFPERWYDPDEIKRLAEDEIWYLWEWPDETEAEYDKAAYRRP